MVTHRGIFMESYEKFIENTILLNHLSKESIISNLNSGKFRMLSYREDNILHFEGEKCQKLEIILSGKVAVERIDESGKLLTISEFGKDDILGGNLIFSKSPYYPMTVSTRTPTLILEVEGEALFELFCGNPEFLRTYLEFISDHATMLGDKIKNYVNKTIRESITSYLIYEYKKQGSSHIRMHTSKKALAEKMGIQRTSLSRELAKMKKEGLILFDPDSITLLESFLNKI